MHYSTLGTSVGFALLTMIELSSGHAVFVDIYGNAKPSIRGYGLGYDATTPRVGTYLYPQQRDITVFSNKIVHDAWWKGYTPNGCGATLTSCAQYYQKNEPKKWFGVSDAQRTWLFSQVTPARGFINIKEHIDRLAWLEWKKSTRVDKVRNKKLLTGIPKVTAGGKVFVLNYQINLDGAGPFKCKIDYKGKADSWTVQDLKVTRNCPGDSYSTFWPGVQKPCWFEVALPTNLDCKGVYGEKGGYTDICIVRCENLAANGPFGACIPIQQIRPVKKVVKKPVAQKKKPAQLEKGKEPNKPDTKKPPVKPPANNKGQPTKPPTNTKGQPNKPTPAKVDQPDEEEEYEEVEEEVLDIDNDPENDDAEKPIAKDNGPADKAPTDAQIKAALGGESFDDSVLKALKKEKISSKDQEVLDEADKDKDASPPDDIGYDFKLRFRRN
ncbi:hypothetical protein ABW20_dc0104683 [Dactylellina cionopaga]|nr:hypothetical protein ABW20_dc0104683 [Dactylellina cionopaga]